MRAYQCCYTNLLRYDGPYKVGGWTATAFPRDIPPEVLRVCEQFQRADASDRATGGRRVTDEFGKPLRLYELICEGGYAYAIRTRYGMLDHMGRGNNLFSHAYILPLDGGFLEHPEALLQMDASCFEQEAGAGTPPEAESAELARRAAERLRTGAAPEIAAAERFDFRKAFDDAGFSTNRERYKTLLQCVYAHMDGKRENGRQAAPLYVQYGSPDASPEERDRQMREILCCILYGLPHWMRRELRASNWSDLDNVPKDLIFTTEDVTRLAGDGGAYLVLRTGARNVERRRMARLERSGYLPYAALRLETERFPAFFAGLDRYAKALGDTDAVSEAVRKLVWQCYWDAGRGAFAERPDVERLDRKELVSLLSDAADSGLYSMGLREVVVAARKKVRTDTLTESLRGSLAAWEAEYRRRQGIPEITETPPERQARAETQSEAGAQTPPQAETASGTGTRTDAPSESAAPPVPETPSATPQPKAAPVAETPEPQADAFPVWEDADAPEPLRVSAARLPVKDWNALEGYWRGLPQTRRDAVTEWLSQLLDKSQNIPIATGIFKKQTERQSQQSLDLYLLLMIDRKVSGKLNPRAIVRAYCLDELTRMRSKGNPERWRTLSEVCSICERMRAPDLTERVRDEAWELYKREAKPGEAVPALRMYEELVDRLYPHGNGGWNGAASDKFRQDALNYYWERTDGNWKHFDFDRMEEYEAFDDGQRHMFPTLIRLAESFRPPKAKEFLKQVFGFFRMSDTPDYFTNENKLRVTGLLYEELARNYPLKMPPDYREWMNLATVAEDKATIAAVQELYGAVFPFDAQKVTERYPRFIWQCKDSGDRKAREAAYPLVEKACFEHDAEQPAPLDLWITIGIEALSFYELYNCFAIFEKKPDAAVLTMGAAEAVRDSSLMGSPGVQDYAQAYIKYRGDPQIKKAVQNWLIEASGGRKKFLGVF